MKNYRKKTKIFWLFYCYIVDPGTGYYQSGLTNLLSGLYDPIIRVKFSNYFFKSKRMKRTYQIVNILNHDFCVPLYMLIYAFIYCKGPDFVYIFT